MTITIQLTEIPENESVTNRVFTLPQTGGNLGSAFDCTIQLPDRTGQVAAIHGRFVPHKQHMTIEAINGCKIDINGMPLASGRAVTIDDGTTLQIADYVLLISQTGQVTDTEVDMDDAIAFNGDQHFSLDDLQADHNDDLVMKTSNHANQQIDSTSREAPQTPHFAASGVFSDDPFDEDPFNDEEISLNANPTQADSITSDNSYVEKIDQDEYQVDFDHDEQVFQPSIVKANSHQSQESELASNPQIDKLVNLLGNQLVSANDQQAKLFKALDKTLSTFIDEFSPHHLEEVYSDFGTPMFVAKEKQYWRLYRKSFNRRLDKGEYHRLFKALLLENMQNPSANEGE